MKKINQNLKEKMRIFQKKRTKIKKNRKNRPNFNKKRKNRPNIKKNKSSKSKGFLGDNYKEKRTANIFKRTKTFSKPF